MSLKDSLSDYDGSSKPSKIILESNFRSRRGITNTVNFIFEKIMSRQVGEIQYDKPEFLNFGAKYFPEKDTPDTELIYLDKDAKSSDEPEIIAEYIKEIIDSGAEITTQSGKRKVTWGDFCILL